MLLAVVTLNTRHNDHLPIESLFNHQLLSLKKSLIGMIPKVYCIMDPVQVVQVEGDSRAILSVEDTARVVDISLVRDKVEVVVCLATMVLLHPVLNINITSNLVPKTTSPVLLYSLVCLIHLHLCIVCNSNNSALLLLLLLQLLLVLLPQLLLLPDLHLFLLVLNQKKKRNSVNPQRLN